MIGQHSAAQLVTNLRTVAEKARGESDLDPFEAMSCIAAGLAGLLF